MISVILIWIYAMITTYLIGFGFLSLTPGINKYTVKNEDSYIIAGIAILTVYAQAFSLLYKVGLAANLILIGICILIVLAKHRQLKEHLRSVRLSVSPLRMLVYGLVFLLFAFGTSRGIIHYDTSLYHAQSIRWIEEYGIVRGLGNLHCRLAYNSSAFCLSALYSMVFLGGQSYHAMAGFLAFWVAKVCLEGIRRGKIPKVGMSDLARVMAVYYIFMIFDEMISPASDYFMVLTFFYIIIRWLELLERKEKSYIPYGLLCLLGVYLMTVKLSAALILLLTIKPAIMMIMEEKISREKKGKMTAGFLGLGMITAVPYLVRNVILSGWLLYPSTFLDLFDVDWKIPKGMAEYDFREIQVWGRGYTQVAQYDMPISGWIQSWFTGQNGIDKIFILAAAGTGLILLLMFLYMLFARKWEMADWLLVSGTISVCFYFWLTSAPLIRYGCVYVWLAPVITYGYLYRKASPHFDKYIVLYFTLAIVGGYKIGAFGKELFLMLPDTWEHSYLLVQKDYENYPALPYELQGYTFYYAESGDRTGYEDFPSSPAKPDIVFRGTKIKEGFRYDNYN